MSPNTNFGSTYTVNYVVKSTILNEQNEILAQPERQGNFDNQGLNFGLGLAKNQFKFLLGLYTSRGNVYYGSSFPIYTPYIKLSYNLVNL